LSARSPNSEAAKCRAKKHEAISHPADAVFADYFDRKPPFDKGGKEFPDAFALKALDAWCARQGERMYVVTQDAAMQRYVERSPHLLLLPTIEELPASARESVEPGGDAEAIADALLNATEFDDYLYEAIESHADELILDYDGAPNIEFADRVREGTGSDVHSGPGRLQPNRTFPSWLRSTPRETRIDGGAVLPGR
jgi:hypothetical protein